MVDSLRVQPMLSYGQNSFQNLFDDYYVFNKLKIFMKAKTKRDGSQVESELTVKNNKCHSKISLQFPWKRYQFWFGATNSDQYKLYSDIGQVRIGPYKPSFFVNFKIDSTLKINSLRVGSFLAGEIFSDQCRIVKEGNEYSFQRRFHFEQKQWDLILLQSISNTPNKPMKNDFQLRFWKKNTEFFLHHYTGNNPGEQYQFKWGKFINYRLEKLSASVVSKISNYTKLGCEINLLNPSLNFSIILLIEKLQFAGETYFENIKMKIKAKFNTDSELSIAFQKKFCSYFSFAASQFIPFGNKSKDQFKYGFQVDLHFD